MHSSDSSLVTECLQLAARHGLNLKEELSFNEMGLDFRIAFAEDHAGRKWVLRIPRRADLLPRIELEKKILAFVKRRLRVQVPDWQICTSEFIAYPMLVDPTALTFDSRTYAVTWHIDPQSENYMDTLAELLVELHESPVKEAMDAGLKCSTPEMVRSRFLSDVIRVRAEIGISGELETQLRAKGFCRVTFPIVALAK